jgi:uncharacterized protein (DUF4213/DUF364 family)
MTTTRHAIVESLRRRHHGRPLARVAEVVAPPGGSEERLSPFTVLTLDDGGGGLCFNLLEDQPSREAYDRLDRERYRGRTAIEVAGDLLHDDLVRRIVGYAACGALSQALFRAGDPAVDTESDLLDLLELTGADHVGLVGYAPPLVRDLAARFARVTVLDRRRDKAGRDNVALATDPRAIAPCGVVVVTSTTLLDDSFEEIEQVTRAATFRALYGPGAGILPEALFSRGFHATAGTLITDGALLAERQRRGEKWGDAKRKFVLRRS